VVGYALLGIETIAVEIENPFGHDFNDLPIDTICQTIEANLFELLERRVITHREQAQVSQSVTRRCRHLPEQRNYMHTPHVMPVIRVHIWLISGYVKSCLPCQISA
jgi:hypothetical protein